jgi:hypothetical protein
MYSSKLSRGDSARAFKAGGSSSSSGNSMKMGKGCATSLYRETSLS